MNYLKKEQIKQKAFLVKGFAEASTCGFEDVEQIQIHVAENEKDALKSVDNHNWGSDELSVSYINETDIYFSEKTLLKIRDKYQSQINVTAIIEKELLEDGQKYRYFRSLFSKIFDRIKGKEIEKPYDVIPKSRLEFLKEIKSVLDYMIQEEINETECLADTTIEK